MTALMVCSGLHKQVASSDVSISLKKSAPGVTTHSQDNKPGLCMCRQIQAKLGIKSVEAQWIIHYKLVPFPCSTILSFFSVCCPIFFLHCSHICIQMLGRDCLVYLYKASLKDEQTDGQLEIERVHNSQTEKYKINAINLDYCG